MSKVFSKEGWYWPLIVVGLLLIPIVANAYLAVRANADDSFAVERDYYKKAVGWDQRMAQEQTNGKLGWRVEVEPLKVVAPGRDAEVGLRVLDAQGQPVAGEVALEAMHNARAALVHTGKATLGPDGRGHVRLPLHRPGLHELRLTVMRGSEVFTWKEHRDAVADAH